MMKIKAAPHHFIGAMNENFKILVILKKHQNFTQRKFLHVRL